MFHVLLAGIAIVVAGNSGGDTMSKLEKLIGVTHFDKA
jgi:hypothetical protein